MKSDTHEETSRTDHEKPKFPVKLASEHSIDDLLSKNPFIPHRPSIVAAYAEQAKTVLAPVRVLLSSNRDIRYYHLWHYCLLLCNTYFALI